MTIQPANAATLDLNAARHDSDTAALRFAASREAALCTIVGIDGSFSRRLGAQFATTEEGRCAGSLSDGCLERELITRAKEARELGQPQVYRFGKGSPFIDFRLPCGSGLDIVIDPHPDPNALAEAIDKLENRQIADLYMPEAAGQMKVRRFLPALKLLVLGSGPECEALERFSGAYGIDCQWCRPGSALAMGQLPMRLHADAWTAIAILFHDHEWERALLQWALSTRAFYVGAIGGRKTRQLRRELLRDMGYSANEIERVRSPVGLIPHARDAAVLGLSILAEVVGAYENLRQ